MTQLYSHPVFLDHDTGDFHPESPKRLNAITKLLEDAEFAGLERCEAREASEEELARVHSKAHIADLLAAIPERGQAALDPDTVVSPRSGEAARRAAGAVCAAVDAVVAGETDNAFCAVRPPGHHAEPERAMGFCIFNNVAIGALHARVHHGLERVAVVDFDVHHGNGTQAVFVRDPHLFYASTHQAPFYPGTGARDERGLGNIVNVPLAAGAGSTEFRKAMSDEILPALRAFTPDLVMISAGFDAHRDDPLAGLRLVEADYRWVTEELVRLARETCGGRVVSALEGGYDLAALAACCREHLRGLAGA
ncbi:MAG: histone deacetylase family protein [Proteobacteria bacterium]|nr:histone deacetylase family protein [Pseudomonadota bacterium]